MLFNITENSIHWKGNNMFRENNRSYYRPDNGSTNHAVTITRPLKRKELLKEKQFELKTAIRHRKQLNEKDPTNTADRKHTDSRIRKLQHKISELESINPQHKVRRTAKKLKPDTIFDYCCTALKQSITNGIVFITAEDVAYQMNTQVCLVKQCFARMNRMGWLSQPSHKQPHDCCRPGYDQSAYSQWNANIYYIQDKAKVELHA